MKDMGCPDVGGTECSDTQECKGGEFVYLSEEMRFCCLGGKCFNLGEYVESTVEMQNQPLLTIAPSGLRASVAQSSLGDYCTERLKGQICDPYEFCDGRWVEYYQDVYCCVGQCGWDASQALDDAYVAELQNETSRPLSQEDMAALYGISAPEVEEPPEIIPFIPGTDLDPVDEKEKLQQSIEEDLAKEERRAAFLGTVSKVTPKIPESIKGFNFTLVIGALLFLLLVVAVLVALFRRSAEKKLAVSEQKVEAVQPAADLQATIDSLVSQGYNYAQVRAFLIGKGDAANIIDAEIRKNYELRKAASLQQRSR
jgi:hypothetical protein